MILTIEELRLLCGPCKAAVRVEVNQGEDGKHYVDCRRCGGTLGLLTSADSATTDVDE